MADQSGRPLDRRRTFQLQTSIGALMGLLVASLSGALLYLEYREGRELSLKYAEARFAQASLNARETVLGILGPTAAVLHGLVDAVEADPTHLADSAGQTQSLLAAIRRSEHIARLAAADQQGNFWMAETVDGADDAPEGARFALHIRQMGIVGPVESRQFFSSSGEALAPAFPIVSDIDFQQEQWFRDALIEPGLVPGDPEPLPDGHGLAAVVALHSPSQNRVLAAFVGIQDLDEALAAHRLTPGTVHLLLGPRGEILAASDPSIAPGSMPADSRHPALRVTTTILAEDAAESATEQEVQTETGTWLGWIFPVATPFSEPVQLAVLSPEKEVLADILRQFYRNLAISVAVALLGIILAAMISRSISRPMRRLTAEAARLEKLEFSTDFEVRTRIAEVARLGKTLRMSETALAGFARYVPGELVRRIVSGEIKPELGGERREVTLLFSDIAGFTTVSEQMDPEALTRALTEYLSRIGTALGEGGATIDKYIGDAVMAFWNAPAEQPDQARLACLAALKADRISRALEGESQKAGLPVFPTRFGLHKGEAIIGNIGSADRMNYTALGSTVNIASRIEGLNKYFGTTVLISEAVRAEAGPGIISRPAGLVVVKGAVAPILVHALMGTDGVDAATDLNPAALAKAEAWRAPFEAYQAGMWATAVEELERYQAKHGPDSLAQATLARARAWLATPPAQWDGIEHMTEK